MESSAELFQNQYVCCLHLLLEFWEPSCCSGQNA